MRRRVTVLVVSVAAPAPTALISTLKMRYVGVYIRLFSLLILGFSINPSVQKLWREKANIQMSMYLSRVGVRDRFLKPVLSTMHALVGT